MNIPKFTAQASLYRTSGHYRFSPSNSGGVPPMNQSLPRISLALKRRRGVAVA